MTGRPLRPPADADRTVVASNMLSAVTYLASVATTAGLDRVAEHLTSVTRELRRISKVRRTPLSKGELQ